MTEPIPARPALGPPAPAEGAPQGPRVPALRDGQVRLRGVLVCADAAEQELVTRHLPRHLTLTRAEPGCLAVHVTSRPGTRVWDVAELFADGESFAAHQRRVADSAWGRATAGIRREYSQDGAEPPAPPAG